MILYGGKALKTYKITAEKCIFIYYKIATVNLPGIEILSNILPFFEFNKLPNNKTHICKSFRVIQLCTYALGLRECQYSGKSTLAVRIYLLMGISESEAPIQRAIGLERRYSPPKRSTKGQIEKGGCVRALTSDVDEEAAGGEGVGLVLGRALVPADVVSADGRKVEEAVGTLHYRWVAVICKINKKCAC